jgi:hypothetical protein
VTRRYASLQLLLLSLPPRREVAGAVEKCHDQNLLFFHLVQQPIREDEELANRIRPRLLRGPEQPFAAQVSFDLLVRNHTPGLAVPDTSTDRLHHVQVVLHVVQAAVVW